jgi:DNA-binding IclR family transcriptional regulator
MPWCKGQSNKRKGSFVQRIQSIDRALDLLESFTEQTPELGVTELAKLLGVTKTSAFRIAETLLSRDYLVKGRESHRYAIGPKVLKLSGLFCNLLDVRALALPHMTALRDAFDEGVSLSVPTNGKRVCVEHVPSTQPVRRVVVIGEVLPLAIGASGKIFLAYGIEGPRGSVTPQELERIRNQGYSVAREERSANTASVSVPVRDHHGRVVAALTMVGLVSQYTDAHIARYLPALKERAAAISRDMGHVG